MDTFFFSIQISPSKLLRIKQESFNGITVFSLELHFKLSLIVVNTSHSTLIINYNFTVIKYHLLLSWQ